MTKKYTKNVFLAYFIKKVSKFLLKKNGTTIALYKSAKF